jgi:hypothetical protein
MARIVEPDRLHRPEAQRIDPALGHHLDRHAAFEIGRVGFPFLELGLSPASARRGRRGTAPCHRAVDVVLGFALVPARGHPARRPCRSCRGDDRGDGIEEGQAFCAGRPPMLPASASAVSGPVATMVSPRTGRRRPVRARFQRGQARQARARPPRKTHRDPPPAPIRRAPAPLRCRHDQRITGAHFVVQQADRVLLVVVGAEAVGADQFGKPIGVMRRAALSRSAHFGQAHAQSAPRQLPGGLAARPGRRR